VSNKCVETVEWKKDKRRKEEGISSFLFSMFFFEGVTNVKKLY